MQKLLLNRREQNTHSKFSHIFSVTPAVAVKLCSGVGQADQLHKLYFVLFQILVGEMRSTSQPVVLFGFQCECTE